MGRYLDLIEDAKANPVGAAASQILRDSLPPGAPQTQPETKPCPPTVPADNADRILAEAVEDLREHWNERAAILEHDAGLPRAQAEEQAAAMTATLARNRAYPWQALRLALAERPDLAAQVPNEPGPVDRLLWGVPRLAILPSRRVIPQGRVQP